MNTQTTAPNQLMGYDVIGSQGTKIGSVDGVWVGTNSSDLKFIGVKTGALGGIGGDTHLFPASSAQIDTNSQQIRVPFTEDQVKSAPTCDPSSALTQDQENQIDSYYQQFGTQGSQGTPGQPTIARTTVPVGAAPASGAGAPGDFPVDNITYDLITLMHQKLKGLEAFDSYIDDAQGNADLSSFLQQLRAQEFQAARQIGQFLSGTLGNQV